MREPVEALTCDMPDCPAVVTAPRSQLLAVAARAGWQATDYCPHHLELTQGLWWFRALAKTERVARQASRVLAEAGYTPRTDPPHDATRLWTVSVTCTGQGRVEELAGLVTRVGAAPVAQPGASRAGQ